jgi:hypothetical protein
MFSLLGLPSSAATPLWAAAPGDKRIPGLVCAMAGSPGQERRTFGSPIFVQYHAVDVAWQALSLSPSWCKGKTILVRVTDAIRHPLALERRRCARRANMRASPAASRTVPDEENSRVVLQLQPLPLLLPTALLPPLPLAPPFALPP